VDLGQLLRLTEERLQRDTNLKGDPSKGRKRNDTADILARSQTVSAFLSKKATPRWAQCLSKGTMPTLSSEQHAALRYVIPQIVAAIETCRLVEGKIQLERELAERTRLAVWGRWQLPWLTTSRIRSAPSRPLSS